VTLEYDLTVGALYIRLADGKAARTRQLDDNTAADLDADGNVLGVEVVAIDCPWAIAEVLALDGISDGDRRELLAYFAPPRPPATGHCPGG
jgi:uncharacterized protein YuzE